MSTSHAPNYVVDGLPQERYQAYHAEKCKGGLALSMFGGSSTVSADSPSAFGQINCSNDRVIPYLQAMADACHQHGAFTMCQLTHMGRRTTWDCADWLPVVAPSRTREAAHRSFPKAMDIADLKRVAADYGRAARRCQIGGLDGIELIAHGHLLDSFWSKNLNRRQDQYGGSLDNRLRFTFEVLNSVRAAVGPDFIVGVRMPGAVSEGLNGSGPFEGELSHEECLEIASRIARTGLIDFLNINVGAVDTENRLASTIPGMFGPLAPQLNLVKSFREFKLPVFHACRIIDLSTARRAIKEGMLDMVGMTRAHMADPHLVNKLLSGRETEIRQCVGAGYCLDRIYVGLDALCLQNAATGREHLGLPHVIVKGQTAKKVVIVGGGVAGLEAARVAASRGHRVVLLEAGSKLGGQIRLAQLASWRRDLGLVADWLEQEISRLKVETRLNTYADADSVLAERPDVVIIASGGVPDTLDQPHAISVWDVLSKSVTIPKGSRVLVYDDHGAYQGPSCAEVLAQQGAIVEIVTPDRHICHEMGSLNWPIFLRNLYRLGVTITPDRQLQGAEQSQGRLKVTLKNEYALSTEERTVDYLVVQHGTLPVDDLYHELRHLSRNDGVTDLTALLAKPSLPQTAVADGRNQDSFQLFRVGDAVSCRNIHAALYDSLRLCKDI
jgi:2,4-dienoyl-CoA reductase-like NADH-dependent reductase (Old Yellow Enzyme family)